MTPRRLFVLAILLLFVGTAIAGKPADHTAEQTRPIPLGVSGGNTEGPCFAGTLGCLVKGRTDGKLYILSNNHVLSTTVNHWTPGDRVTQPGLLDNGCTVEDGNTVANVSDVQPLLFNGTANAFDAGIAEVVSGKVDTDGTLLGLGSPDPTPVSATVGLSVRKSGRTTGVTKGTVQFTNVNINVSYGSGRVGYFTGQVAIGGGGFSQAGDSGSLIITTDLQPVALLFAGGSGYTFACPIEPILDHFDVDVVGTGTSSGGGKGGGGGHGKKPKSRAEKAQGRYGKSLLARSGVVGHGVGLRGGSEVVAIFVEDDTLAVRMGLPTSLDGVPVVVVKTGKITAYAAR